MFQKIEEVCRCYFNVVLIIANSIAFQSKDTKHFWVIQIFEYQTGRRGRRI